MARIPSEQETPTRKSGRKVIPSRRLGSPVEVSRSTSMTAISESTEDTRPDTAGGAGTSAPVNAQSASSAAAARKVGNRRVVTKKRATKIKDADPVDSGRRTKPSRASTSTSKKQVSASHGDSEEEVAAVDAEEVIDISSGDETSDPPSVKRVISEALDSNKKKIAAVTQVKDKIMVKGSKRRIAGSDDDVEVLPPSTNNEHVKPPPSPPQKPVVKRQKTTTKKKNVDDLAPVTDGRKILYTQHRVSPERSNDIFDVGTQPVGEPEDEDGHEGTDYDEDDNDLDEQDVEQDEEQEEEQDEEQEHDSSQISAESSDAEVQDKEEDDRPRLRVPPKPSTVDSDEDRPVVLRSVGDVDKSTGNKGAGKDKGPAPNPDLFKQFEDPALVKTYKDLPALKYWVDVNPYRGFGGRATGNVLFGSLKYHLQCHQTYSPCRIPLPYGPKDPICPHVKEDLEFIKKSICFQQKDLTVINLSRISPDILHVTSQKESALAVLNEDRPVLCASMVANPAERGGFSFKYLSGVFYTFEWQRWLSVVGTVYDQTEGLVARMDGDAIQLSISGGGTPVTAEPSTPSSRPPLFSPSKTSKPVSSPLKGQVNRALDLNDKVPIYDARLGVVDRAINWDKWIHRLDQVGLPEFMSEIPGGSTAMVGYTVTRWKPTKAVQGTDPVLSLNLQWVVVITSPVVD
ncbi:hypothetical protein OE88DRAFT_1643253 [Heliocybe sulcata]|uniref:Uncharacterized protein n=1 Tax=Heliocybe sulcata TaxID=5364 RepID=A0A5C3N9I8_9AGAM|nr:hypothetical protein OE88DRAFT_1643253 [Heliocybe sulcata]